MSRPPADWMEARLASFRLDVAEDLSDDDTPPPTAPPSSSARRPPPRASKSGRAVGGTAPPPVPPPADGLTALAALPPAASGEVEPSDASLVVPDGALETADGRPSAAALAAHRAAGGHAFVGPVDREQVAAQRRAVWDIVKGLGGRLLRDGLNLTRTSLPVAVFEPRSFVQRVADNWAYLGLLDTAAASPDPAERVRLVAAFVAGGLSRQTSTLKPFNPILGETWAAEFVGTGRPAGVEEGEEGEEEVEGAPAPASTPFAAATPTAPPKKKSSTPAWVRSLTARRGKAGAGAAAAAGPASISTARPATPPASGWTHAGAAVWAEQISHHPPATAWLVESRAGRENAGDGAGPEPATPQSALARAASLGARRPASPPASSQPSTSASTPPNSWTFTGVGTWAAHFRGNSIAGRQAGGNAVHFAGDPSRGSPPSTITWELPPMAMRGIMFGARVLRYTGTITLTDAGHGIVAEVGIGGAPPGPAGEVLSSELKALSRREAPPGSRDGGGLRPDDLVGVLLVRGAPVDTLVGSWLSHCDWLGRPPLSGGGGGGGKGGAASAAAPRRLWDATRDAAAAPVPLAGGGLANGAAALLPSVAPTPRRTFSRSRSAAATPRAAPGTPGGGGGGLAHSAALPSDALTREDLVALKAGDPGGSQAWKTRLEERQRAERGWRKAGREAAGMEAAE